MCKGKTTGWICPKCGRVYGPHIAECAVCNNDSPQTIYPCYPCVPFYPVNPNFTADGTADYWGQRA